MAQTSRLAQAASGLRDLSGLANVGLPGQNVVPGAWPGLVKPGNLNLATRPVVHNPDGSISTVKSVSFDMGGNEVLLPEVIGNQVVSPMQALAHYRGTGENLGTFTNPDTANAYAQRLHLAQAAQYRR